MNYEHNSKNVAKYIPQVKKAREENVTDFSVEENRIKGKSTAALASQFKPKSDMELKIAESLKKQGLSTEQSIQQQEKELLANIDPKELEARIQHMQKVKGILFRNEMKHKRVKKIKSKLYHKLKKKAKEREEEKLLTLLEENDPDAAREYREK